MRNYELMFVVKPTLEESAQNEAVIKCESYINGTSTWNYLNYNLLNQISRMKIKQNCECGNLLDGETSSFPDIVIYNGILDGIQISFHVGENAAPSNQQLK